MNKKPTIIAFIHYLFTFINDLLFINFKEINIINYIFIKIILLLLLLVVWNYGFKIFKRKDSKTILKYFLIILIPLLILLLLIYPGIWYSDDFNFLEYAKTCNFLYYLHYITSIYYSISLSLIPIPTGVAIIQIIIYSLVVTYIIYNLIKIFDIKKWYKYLLYIVFILPMTLFYAIYPNRPCIYGIFYLLFFSIIFFKIYKKEDISFKQAILLLIYSSLLAQWRSEGIYLLLFGPLLICLISNKKTIKNFLLLFIISLVSFFIISLPQNINTKYKYKNYSLSRFVPSVINPLGWMIDNGAITNNIEDLNNINEVIDVDKMLEYPVLYDTPCVWNNKCVKEYNGDYKKFMKSYFNYIIQNKGLFIKAKILTFMMSSGWRNSTFEAHDILKIDNDIVNNFKNNYHFNKVINPDIRNIFISLLEGRSFTSHDPLKTYIVINNLLTPLFFLGLTLLYFLFTKKIKLVILNLLPFIHTALILLTAPASYFMYYYPVYLVGYFILLFDIALIIKKLQKRKCKNV